LKNRLNLDTASFPSFSAESITVLPLLERPSSNSSVQPLTDRVVTAYSVEITYRSYSSAPAAFEIFIP
jgi:hypothetical protein